MEPDTAAVAVAMETSMTKSSLPEFQKPVAPASGTSSRKRAAVSASESSVSGAKKRAEERSIVVPSNRKSPLKDNWKKIVEVLVTNLKLQARVISKKSPWRVEMRQTISTDDESHLQKGADFVEAFMKGFEIEDAKVLVRMEGLYVETFHMGDVKQTLKGDHMARAVGRVCGINGRTKHTIENTTRTRVVIADQTVHILGTYQNIQVARRALCDLIMGSPPNKVYGRLRANAARVTSSF